MTTVTDGCLPLKENNPAIKNSLTQNVGNSHDFLQEITDEWKVTAIGRTEEVKWMTGDGEPYIFLKGDKPQTAENKREATTRCWNLAKPGRFGHAQSPARRRKGHPRQDE